MGGEGDGEYVRGERGGCAYKTLVEELSMSGAQFLDLVVRSKEEDAICVDEDADKQEFGMGQNTRGGSGVTGGCKKSGLPTQAL